MMDALYYGLAYAHAAATVEAVMTSRRKPVARVKPRIRRALNVTDKAYEYVCSDTSECYAMGWGKDPEAAYEQWLVRFARCRRERQQ